MTDKPEFFEPLNPDPEKVERKPLVPIKKDKDGEMVVTEDHRSLAEALMKMADEGVNWDVSKASHRAHIKKSQINAWLKDPLWGAWMFREYAGSILPLVHQMRRAAMNGDAKINIKAIELFLRYATGWSEKQSSEVLHIHQHTGTVTIEAEHQLADRLSAARALKSVEEIETVDVDATVEDDDLD